MNLPTNIKALAFCIPAVVAIAATATSPARAESIISTPGAHPLYHVELEPHVAFGWDGIYGLNGFGLGGRASIPIVNNGFVTTINNNVAIGFGADLIKYIGCANGGCDATVLMLPAALQWNFYLAPEWSVFGEPGVALFYGTYGRCEAGRSCSSDVLSVRPTIAAGGRYHFPNKKFALTLRVGYPETTFGVSFF